MNWQALSKLLGFFSCIIASLIGVSALISWLYHEEAALNLLLSGVFPMAGGLGLMQFAWQTDIEDLSHKDGTLVIALSWILAIFWGAFPYYVLRAFGDYSFLSFINSLFESTAGFTTTAASVLVPGIPLETLPKGLIFWRALSQWLGGLGIILIALFFLPFIRAGGMELFQTTTVARERLRRRVGKTSGTVLMIYVVLTLLCVAALEWAGMNLFDSLCHAFSTISSGGFSTRTANIQHFQSGLVETVLIVFMLLGTINYTLHFSFVGGDYKSYWRSQELRTYTVILGIAFLLIAGDFYLHMDHFSWGEIVFNTVAIGSTTGFWDTNISMWPSFSQGVLVILMFIGGMVGSPSGAIKAFRITLLIKYVGRQIHRIVHPAGFTPVKLEGKVVEREVLDGILSFFILYMMIFTVGSMIMQAIGYSPATATSAVASTLGGVGPSFNGLGVSGGYYSVPLIGKLTLMSCMLLGRVEIFPILILLSREFWRK